MIKDYPEYNEALVFEAETDSMEKVIELIKAIRTRRAEMGVVPSRKAQLFIETKYADAFSGAEPFFAKLASASSLTIVDACEDESAVRIITDAATAYIPLADMVDFEAERKRLEGELKAVEGEIARAEGKLGNEGFIARAPAAVVEGEREKLRKYIEKKESILSAIEKLK